ncbi:MAG: hypothetical protein HFH75_19440 [Lachnospiraceae bacterium]|jgi:hypothetical protein|nr:hypothetical protein [Lachnospiraceae bacterium]
MKKICTTVLKVFGVAVLFLVMSLLVLLVVTPFANDHVARKTAKELADLPLPEDTEYIESVYKADKLNSHSVFYAHGHPEEECQQKLTGARRASSGEGHFPARFIRI